MLRVLLFAWENMNPSFWESLENSTPPPKYECDHRYGSKYTREEGHTTLLVCKISGNSFLKSGLLFGL